MEVTAQGIRAPGSSRSALPAIEGCSPSRCRGGMCLGQCIKPLKPQRQEQPNLLLKSAPKESGEAGGVRAAVLRVAYRWSWLPPGLGYPWDAVLYSDN